MATADHCRAMAVEAERLASIVSYGRDRSRLLQQACDWREKAAALDATGALERQSIRSEPAGMIGWLKRRCG